MRRNCIQCRALLADWEKSYRGYCHVCLGDKLSFTHVDNDRLSRENLRLTALLNEALTNDYCDLHKSPQEGEGCPVCLGIERREEIITRWANDRKRLIALLRECEEVVDYGLHGGENAQDFWDNYPILKTQLLLPKLAEFKEKPQ